MISPEPDGLHSTLRRQLRRLRLAEDTPPRDATAWQDFLAKVTATYADADQAQYLHDRAIAVSSRELASLAEEVSRRSATELALERDRLQAVFDSVSTGLVVVDRELRVVDLNRAGAELLSATDPKHLGESLWHVLAIEELAAQDLEQACRDGKPWSRPETNLGLRDGTTVPVSLQFTPLRSARLPGAGRPRDTARASEAGGGVLTVTDLSERKRVEFETAWLAAHDPLTGLMNRAALVTRLDEALARARNFNVPAAVVFIDLDHFKTVNDTMGHPVGDRLLMQVAERLERVARRVDALGRFGGDEFVIVSERVSDAHLLTGLAEAITQTMRDPFDLGTGAERVYISASVGAALSHPGSSADDLMRDADLALYEAKRRGRDGWVLYDVEMRRVIDRRAHMERQLRAALDDDDLQVHFQPIFSSAGNSIVGFEGLMRWWHEDFGNVGPGTFVPLAEDIGLIGGLGEVALRRSVEFAGRLRQAFPRATPYTAVNVSAVQVAQTDLAAILNSLLRGGSGRRLPGSALTLELTESALLVDPDSVRKQLTRVTGLGVTLAIDDFGTGFGSLANLRGFPIGAIKVDPAFSRGVGQAGSDEAIVKAIVDLGHALGAEVVAEGVETADQLRALQTLGCDAVQGHLLGRAMPPDDAIAFALAHAS